MQSVVDIHRRIYEKEKPYNTLEVLYKLKPGNTPLAYNKGMLAMHELYEIIGEEKLNKALKSFLSHYDFSSSPPTAIDLINECLAVSDARMHEKIRKIFMLLQKGADCSNDFQHL